jgi:uracil-DNA glycosylase
MKASGHPPAQSFFPARTSLATLGRAVQACRACPLYRDATRAVFGEGPADAALMMVGEKPGDEEDRRGHPFVGGSGRLLDRFLGEVGLRREEIFLTNVVKHFKFEVRGKRRIHKSPNSAEVNACLPWLEAELGQVHPEMIVCLGATAARAIIGPEVRVTRDRGRVYETPRAPWVMPTLHPSALLRSPAEVRRRNREAFLDDLRQVADRYRELQPA